MVLLNNGLDNTGLIQIMLMVTKVLPYKSPIHVRQDLQGLNLFANINTTTNDKQ